MANTTVGPTIQFDGTKKLINIISVSCDGATAEVIPFVDVSALTANAVGQACTQVALNKIWYSVSTGQGAVPTAANVGGPIELLWNTSGNANTGGQLAIGLAYDNSFDMSTIGGLRNPLVLASANNNGDVLVNITASVNDGSDCTLICEWLKYYNNY
tara:strand:- start:1695 stop:2165 length:471 start_codon:yes stop_codon:yes gene_type:complete